MSHNNNIYNNNHRGGGEGEESISLNSSNSNSSNSSSTWKDAGGRHITNADLLYPQRISKTYD